PYYRVDSSESVVKVFGAILGGAGAVLAGIAALSLLVGGIGIMNIMLVSVTERTREIGLRKALGAKRGAVLTQFLVEAGTLSLVGGLIGMTLAYVLGVAVTFGTAAAKFPHEGGLTTPFPVTAAVLATIFSAGIGILFGLYPALSASRLDPIVALRRE
ncbi:FtsX-like permease family protein, partial [bacterium]